MAALKIAFTAVLALTAAPQSNFLATYRGTPFHDARYQAGPQIIPGKVDCAFYDLGGEGVAYHDTDPENHGSGELNPADGTYLNEFRLHEGVDISYTKFGKGPKLDHQIDDNPYDLFRPPANQLYVGWTEPGEWFNLTVRTAHAGLYRADLLYTSNRGGAIALDVNGTRQGPPVEIASTFAKADPIAWRQWHHWNLKRNAMTLHLPAGKSVLTVHIVSGGQMNLATFDFHEAH